MSRQLYARLQPEDGRFAYGTYVDLVLVQAAGGCRRKHHARHCDFRRGKVRIGDHVTWQRPQRCPQSMAPNEFQAPDTVHVREVHCSDTGFRPKQIILVTTLLDPKRYPKAKLSALSSALASDGSQFQAPQTTLNMEMIWAKSPQMVRKEI